MLTRAIRKQILFWMSLFLLLEINKRVTFAQTQAIDEANQLDLSTALKPHFFADMLGNIYENPAVTSLFKDNQGHVNFALIDVSADFLKKVTRQQLLEAKIFCLTALKEILGDNSWIAREHIIKNLKLRKLQIILHYDTKDPRIGWIHTGIKNIETAIIINYRPEHTNVEYQATLLNELDSYVNYGANKQCGIQSASPIILMCRYLKNNGEIDELFLDKLEAEITVGVAKIAELNKIWTTKLSKLKSEERRLLSDFLIAVKHFTPTVSHIYPHDYANTLPSPEEIAKGLKSGVYKIRDGHLESGPKFPKNSPRFFKSQQKADYVVVWPFDGCPRLRDRINGFFNFIRMQLKFSETVVYKKSIQHFGSHIGVNEFINFIAELPDPLIKFFFNDLRETSIRYLNRCNPLRKEPQEECRVSQWNRP